MSEVSKTSKASQILTLNPQARSPKGIIEIIPSEIGKTWIVKQTFTVKTRFGNVTVKEGFRHDKFSFAPNLKNEIPAIVHDWLCNETSSGHKTDEGLFLTRPQADLVFFYLLRECGYKCVAYIYYAGVSIGTRFSPKWEPKV